MACSCAFFFRDHLNWKEISDDAVQDSSGNHR